jgi:nucleoside-diphosphate-sugar epimerase
VHNCLEAARAHGAAFLFLSTSRIYPIGALNDLPFTEAETRFRWDDVPGIRGFSGRGIAEGFTLEGARSFDGTSKLAGEHLMFFQRHLIADDFLADRLASNVSYQRGLHELERRVSKLAEQVDAVSSTLV